MPRQQHFRGVIWPRHPQETDGQKTYRYVVLGMVVTTEPLETLEGRNEVVLDGHAAGIAEAIDTIRKVKPSRILGDAVDVLCSLQTITNGEPEDPPSVVVRKTITKKKVKKK